MRLTRYGLAVTVGAVVGSVAMLAGGAFGAGTSSGTLSMAAGTNLKVGCPNALTNSGKQADSETVQCAAATTTTTQPTTTTVPQTTTTVPSSGGSWACTTSAAQGHCAFPANSQIVGPADMSDPYVDQNVWSGGANWEQTLSANSPQDWQVVANMAAGNTGVVSFPNTGVTLGDPVDSFTQTTATLSEEMPHNPQTTGWGMFDLWYNNWADEVMVQYDFSNNGDCDVAASTVIDGQSWHLCDFGGGTMAVKLGAGEGSLRQSEPGGTFDLLAISKWLEQTGHLPAGSTWTAISAGWEICSTGGQNETWSFSDYNLTVK